MKKISVFICACVWTIFLFASVSAQEFKTIRDGVEYAEMTRGTREEPVHINLLRLDLTKVRLDVEHAMDAAIGLEKTSSIAARHNALAAINAGFFRLDRSIFAGDATGILQINGNILSESYAERIALLINNKTNQTEVNFDHINLSGEMVLGKNSFKLSGLNRQRGDNELIIFKPMFHRTTLTDSDGLEIIVIGNKIVKFFDRKGSSEIPYNGFVISASGKMREKILPLIKINRKVSFSFTNLDFKGGNDFSYERLINFQSSEDIVSGVPQLIRDGKIEITWEQENLQNRLSKRVTRGRRRRN